VPFSYAIDFENLATASLAAQTVTVTDPIDTTKFDPATISLGPVVIGGEVIATPPPGLRTWSTVADLPDPSLKLGIDVAWVESTHQLRWTLTTLDAATGELPEDPVVGFLPPDTAPPNGQGTVNFTIDPRTRTDGLELTNQASIVFDANAPIATNVWRNTLDGTKPTSEVSALGSVSSSPSIPVHWTGIDELSGLAGFRLMVQDGDGPPSQWFSTNDPSTTTATFTGALGHTYRFWSEAWDRAGNVEAAPSAPDATTTVVDQPVVAAGVAAVTEGNSGTVVLNVPVKLSAPSSTTVSVHYTSVNSGGAGLATPDVDYDARSGTVTFGPGETSKVVPLTVHGDLIDEPPALYGEWAVLSFSDPVGATLDTSFFGLGIGVTLDDDPMPVIRPGVGAVTERDTGTVTLNVPVTLSNPSAVPVTVSYASIDTGGTGIATPGVDYVGTSGSLTFAPGETAKVVSVTVKGDAVDEPPALYGEWVVLSFSNPSASAKLDTSFFGLGIGIIVDDD
jgi:hypothetical protein